MHTLLSAFFAFIFSFGQAAPPRSAATETAQAELNVLQFAPTRQELAQAETANRYAGSACLSCRRPKMQTTISWRAR